MKEELEKELRKIWDNNEFVVGVISNAKTDECMEKMIQFIRTAYERGDTIIPENLTIMSVLLMNEREKNECKN